MESPSATLTARERCPWRTAGRRHAPGFPADKKGVIFVETSTCHGRCGDRGPARRRNGHLGFGWCRAAAHAGQGAKLKLVASGLTTPTSFAFGGVPRRRAQDAPDRL